MPPSVRSLSPPCSRSFDADGYENPATEGGDFRDTLRLNHPGVPLSAAEFEEIAAQQILVDWQDESPQALLLQTCTQPIFEKPTFFFELIERRQKAEGFGEGNFRALFEAIEREQLKRGSLGIK